MLCSDRCNTVMSSKFYNLVDNLVPPPRVLRRLGRYHRLFVYANAGAVLAETLYPTRASD